MIRVENKNGGVLYATIVIVIILELLGMFSYFSNSVRAEPLLEKKNMQVQKKVEKQQKRNKIIIKTEPTTIDQLLGEYATNFDSSKSNRAANIELAARMINNFKLKPGASFSYNKTVGQRTEERGFKVAPVIVNKKPVLGVGGGICQVSSTLYNAILEAGLKVLERHPHSKPVNYVPSGRDATVAYDYLDLKFENNLKKYIIIKTAVTESTVLAQVYSLK